RPFRLGTRRPPRRTGGGWGGQAEPGEAKRRPHPNDHPADHQTATSTARAPDDQRAERRSGGAERLPFPAMKGFRQFILRGNLVDLAVAVVIGAQFSDLVKGLTSSFIDP